MKGPGIRILVMSIMCGCSRATVMPLVGLLVLSVLLAGCGCAEDPTQGVAVSGIAGSLTLDDAQAQFEASRALLDELEGLAEVVSRGHIGHGVAGLVSVHSWLARTDWRTCEPPQGYAPLLVLLPDGDSGEFRAQHIDAQGELHAARLPLDLTRRALARK